MVLDLLTISVLVLFGIGLLLRVVFRKKARQRLAQLGPEQRAIALKQRSLSLILGLMLVLGVLIYDLGPQLEWPAIAVVAAQSIVALICAVVLVLTIRLYRRSQQLDS